MSGVPSDERSGLSFVIVIVSPLLVNIYRFTSNAHDSDIYKQYVQGPCQSRLSTAALLKCALWKTAMVRRTLFCRLSTILLLREFICRDTGLFSRYHATDNVIMSQCCGLPG
jgi:hypothetical protein